MRITNEQKSATMVTINLKVNPYDSYNNDVNTAIYVNVYSDYVISF